MYRILFVLVLLLPLTPVSSEAFVFRKIVYCSPIEGFIHWQGKPLANVVVTRELYSGGFEGGKYSDTATTGSDGRFKFEVVQERRFFEARFVVGESQYFAARMAFSRGAALCNLVIHQARLRRKK